MPSSPSETFLSQPAGSTAGEDRARKIVQQAQGRSRNMGPQVHHQIREEAAALFAAGETRNAIQTLLTELNQKMGNVDRPVWFLLLDIYQTQGEATNYERVAELFSKKFNTSPPAWDPYEEKRAVEGAGRNALVIDGPPSVVSEEKIRDFVRASKKAGSSRLDLSRLRLDVADPEMHQGLGRLCSTMALLRQARVKALLMGETSLVQKINHDIEAGHLDDATSQPLWLFLLECLQWRGEEERFETLAERFAIHFFLSPPGYEPEGAVAIPPSSQRAPSAFQLPDMVDLSDLERLYSDIDHQLGERGRAEIDLRPVRRMTYEAATQLADFIRRLKIAPASVAFTNATEILSALFDITGLSSLVSVVGKKR
jgi:ABC-type transporter Mla MlaB component